jgi:phospholipase C
MSRKRIVVLLLGALVVSVGTVLATGSAGASGRHEGRYAGRHTIRHGGMAIGDQGSTRTPIKHVVVIFQENVSFDHYFGTYPDAANSDGQPFNAAPGTPAVDGFLPATDPLLPANLQHSTNLLTTNPNTALPQRLDSTPTGAGNDGLGQLTCDQDHNYSDEQNAFDGGAMDRFVQATGTGSGTAPGTAPGGGAPCTAAQVMDYYDGNSVTGIWNYAQHYAMSDNSYGTTFGPSAPGAINVTSGDTGSVDMTHTVNSPSISSPTSPNADLTADGQGGYSLTSDAQPYWDDCSTRDAVAMAGTNIGDELNAAGVSWGWFQGGFRPSTSFSAALTAIDNGGQPASQFTPDEFKSYGASAANRPANASNQGICNSVHPVGVALGGTGRYGYKDDYIPHHEPFQYYASTANPHHLTIPTNASGTDTLSGLATIGTDTQSYVSGTPQFNTPNHQYDTSDFNQLVAAVSNGELPPSALPAVSYLKAPGYQDGHGGYSDPADEQQFITSTINALMKSPDWHNTVVIVNYDDSDGWYDHVYSGVINSSLSPADNLTPTNTTLPTSGKCGPSPQTTPALAGEQGRCGFGPRLPMMVISPYAKRNYIDHNLSDQASIVNLIEYNWGLSGIPGSADQVLAGTEQQAGIPFDLAGMFNFQSHEDSKLILDPSTGQPVDPNQSENH